MSRTLILFTVALMLIFACSKREGAVKDIQEMEPESLLEQAENLYEQGDIQKSQTMYEQIYTNYPTSREYIDAAIGLSRCYNDMGEYEKGMEILYNLLSENMVPSRVPEIYNEMAKYYEVNAGISSLAGISEVDKDYQKAIEYYRKAIHYPNSEDKQAKSYAQYKIGELYINMSKFKDATLAFQSTIHSFPDTRWANRAQQRMDEMRTAVNNVLSDTQRTEAPQLTPTESATTPKKVEETPSTADTTKTPVSEPSAEEVSPESSEQIADTSAVQQDTVTSAAEDTLQSTSPDTSAKPDLDFK